MPPKDDVALIAIGRNEGERLKSCLRSVMPAAKTVVYVDSGSTDGTPQFAAAAGCRVVELDPAKPFSAARARNEGFACVQAVDPDVPFIQFLDGDCDLMDGWLDAGVAALRARPDVAIVCGHVRELFPEATIYNKLADLQWQMTPGEILSSGGRFLIRTEVFAAVDGFRADVIAAEDDEFCIRVRAQGWKILQLDAEMARHDMAMTRFSEFWRRSKRTGHAYAHVAALHAGNGEAYFVRDIRRILVWALVVPLLALCAAPFTRGLSLVALVGLYGLQFVHNYLSGRRRGWSARDSLISSYFNAIFKFPALLGLLEYQWRHWRGESFRIIEYRRSA
jgi:glycosyltransferase involved in cell wall biosynthesis